MIKTILFAFALLHFWVLRLLHRQSRIRTPIGMISGRMIALRH